jgi:long-chain acyl-CoA synthetase
MNIYQQIKSMNATNLSKVAMTIQLQDRGKRSYTYQQVFLEAFHFETILKQASIKSDDRIAIIAESSPEWSIAYLAIQKIGGTAVLLDASLDSQDLVTLIEHSEVRGIFASPNIIEKLETISDIPVFNLLKRGELFPWCVSKTCSVERYTENKDVSSIIFSSGTTKKASGIMHSHDSLLLSAQNCIESNRLTVNDRFLAILPNSHIYGLVCQLIGPLLVGATTCFVETLSPDTLSGAFINFRPTVLPAVPKVYELLKTQVMQKITSDSKTKKLFTHLFPICLKLRKHTGINLGKTLFKAIHTGFGGQLRILCSAGAPLGKETADFYFGVGFDMLITYGATETCIPTIGNRGKNITTDSCGKPYPNILVKVSDSGELLIKSPYTMLGYFKDEQATMDANNLDGWFLSGDLGQVDEKGNVKILGRCKENIVLPTGKKIAPDDVESAYCGIRDIRDMVICGIPVSDGSYDEIHAFVVSEIENTDDVLKCLKERSNSLSQNMKLIGIHFIDEIPKTSLQKPKRYLLRKMVLEGTLAKTTPLPQTNNTDIASIVKEAVMHASNADVSSLLPNTKIFIELSIDSLSSIELACEIEARCGVKVDHILHKDMTLSELIEFVESPVSQNISLQTDLFPKVKNQFDYNVFKFARNVLCLLYRIKVKNETVLPENSGYIICANHVSNFDYLYVTLNFKRERFKKFCCMAKKELFGKNFLSIWIGKIAGMIPMDRGGAVHESMSVIREKLEEKWGILIHPEGTRTGDGTLGTFKKGAAALAIDTNVPVVPAYIKGGYEVYPRTKKLPKLFNWKKMKRYQIDVIYGEPILPKGLTPEELIQEIEMAVKKLADSASFPLKMA